MIDQSISQFWDKYINKAKTYNIKESAIRWHVRHAETYIKSHKNKRLAEHLQGDLETYLKNKGRSTRLEDWQFVQIVTALKILLLDLVQLDWAKNFPWDEWEAHAQGLKNNHSSVSRDYENSINQNLSKSLQNTLDKSNGLFKQVFTVYPHYIEQLVKHIRLKHYSVRTEQSYLNWVMRFICFHTMTDPSTLNESDISKYLEHLVIKRRVASSTQSQALNALVFFYKVVLDKNLSDQIQFARSKKPKRLPVVLSKNEITLLFRHINNPTRKLMANLLYGCGMRLMECVRLRIQDVDFDYQLI